MEFIDEKKLAAHLQTHPYLDDTARLYQKLAAAVAASGASVEDFPQAEAMPDLVKDGVPLLQQPDLQLHLLDAAVSILPQVLEQLAAAELPQETKAAAEKWLAQATERTPQRAILRALLCQDEAELTEFIKSQKLDATLVRLVGWSIFDGLVPEEAKSHALWQKANWQRNYCPVCGRKPVMSQLRKEENGRARFLVCDGCHTEWPFARTTCAYCGNHDLKQMHVLEPEGEEKLRLDVCDACQHYIKTYIDEGEEELYLRDWTSMQLDFAAAEQGLKKEGSILEPEA